MLERGLVLGIEGRLAVGIDVQHGNQAALAIEDRNDDLRLSARVARDVTREFAHVVDEHGRAPRGPPYRTPPSRR